MRQFKTLFKSEPKLDTFTKDMWFLASHLVENPSTQELVDVHPTFRKLSLEMRTEEDKKQVIDRFQRGYLALKSLNQMNEIRDHINTFLKEFDI